MAPNDKLICGLSACGKNITKSQGSLSCSFCSKWYHATCVGVSSEQLEWIMKSKGALGFANCPCMKNLVCDNGVKNMSFHDELKTGLSGVQDKFDKILDVIKRKLNCQLNELKFKVDSCIESIDKLDITTSNRIAAVEDQCRSHNNLIEMMKTHNDILRKRLNRCDIIINGLPKFQPNVLSIILKICRHLNVDVNESDINMCLFINNGSSVLVKFTSMMKRDTVMRSYFKSRTLMLSDAIDTDIRKRIFLNDHLTPRAERLCFNCRKLRKEKKIVKFHILNNDILKVKITFDADRVNVFTLDEFYSYFAITEYPPNDKLLTNDGNGA